MPVSALDNNIELSLIILLAGEDFVRLPQERTLTFNATTRTRCVEVEILEDDVIEGNETLFFSLSTSDPAVQIDNAPSAVIIIIDNDGMYLLSKCTVIQASRSLHAYFDVVIGLLCFRCYDWL